MSVQAARETEPLLAPKKDRRQLSCCCKLSYKPRKFSSKGAVLVLVWVFLIVSAFPFRTVSSSKGTFDVIFGVLLFAVGLVACIAAGWLADVRVGRLKMVKVGLTLIWLGVLLLTVNVTATSVVNGKYKIIFEPLFYIGGLSANLGVAIFATNAMQFGLEQMPDASSEAITAFLSWFMIAISFGIWLRDLLSHMLSHCLTFFHSHLIIHTINFALLSIAMCCMFLFGHWLIDHRQNRNPLKTVYRVLKFAKQHKYPVNRSAFTYWEDEIPSRIDLGKSKYGGPFTTEEVEDVKTFFRILVVSGVVMCFMSAVIGFDTLSSQYFQTKPETSCKISMLHSIYILVSFVLVIYEILVYPLVIARCSFTSLKRIGICLFCVFLGCLVYVSLDLVSRFGGIDVKTFFVDHYELQIIIVISLVFVIYIFLTAFMEFVQSQSPENMKGFLNGSLLTGLMISSGIALIAVNLLKDNLKTDSNHDIYASTTVTVFTLVVFVVYCCVARWYKRRERDEPCNERAIIEEIYGRRVEHNSIEETD